MKNYLGGGYKLSKILIGVSILVIIGVAVVGRITHASYSSTISVPLVNGKITYKHPDFRIMAVHVKDSSGNYTETDRMPGSDYMINESKTYCTKGSSSEKDTEARIYTDDLGQHVISNLLKNDRCYLYFEERGETVSDILAKYKKDDSRVGEITTNFTESTPTTVYSKEDDNGTSYVFAGVNPNNWVKLGNLYFRIIRFNGDGTMRLIFSGDGKAETTGGGTVIGYDIFNESAEENEYVGLQYTIGEVHGNNQNSTILGSSTSTDTTTLYGWYNNTIKSNYERLIDQNAGFCSDRDPYINWNGTTSGGGTGTTTTYYGAYIRYRKGGNYQTTYIPTLKCKNASDNLKLPVGLITVDEYMLAGGGIYRLGYENTTFWLHTGLTYWTMTPFFLNGTYAIVFDIDGNGCFDTEWVHRGAGIRPVINLKSSTTFLSGDFDGSAEKPWTVKI